MPLKLVNPQPMETLPDVAQVFVESRDDIPSHEGHAVVDTWEPALVRSWQEYGGMIFYAWSYTATFDGGGAGE